MSRRPSALALATATSLTLAFGSASAAQAAPALPCLDAAGVVVGCPAPPPAPAPALAPAPAPAVPAAPAPSNDPCDDANVAPTPANIQRVREAVLCLVNRERKQHGARALHLDSSLDKAATRFSQQMVRQAFFDHRSPGGSTLDSRVRKTSYLQGARSWGLGENIFYGTGSLSTPGQTVSAWMHSPGHRRNMLDRSFREVGVGVAPGAPVRLRSSQTAATYTTDFGRRAR